MSDVHFHPCSFCCEPVECTCFGKFLGGAVNWWSILRNVVLLAIIWPVARYGPGMLAVENAFNRAASPLDRNG